jgi:hypothetical protein
MFFTIGFYKNPEVKLSWAERVLGWVTLQEVGYTQANTRGAHS